MKCFKAKLCEKIKQHFTLFDYENLEVLKGVLSRLKLNDQLLDAEFGEGLTDYCVTARFNVSPFKAARCSDHKHIG